MGGLYELRFGRGAVDGRRVREGDPVWRTQDPTLAARVRPLVEAYQAFWLADSRHIRTLRLTPSQFDVIATLGDTDGMTCSELSARTLVTKGTLTGVLDRLVAKGLIRREAVDSDRRRVKVQLTEKGNGVFQKAFAAHIAFLKPFFEQAMSPKEINDARRLLPTVLKELAKQK